MSFIVTSGLGSGLIVTGGYGLDGPAPVPDVILVQAGAVDGVHVSITFSEAVKPDEALDITNYTVSDGLLIFDGVQLTPTIFVLRTSIQIVGQVYTLTASNIHSLDGSRSTGA